MAYLYAMLGPSLHHRRTAPTSMTFPKLLISCRCWCQDRVEGGKFGADLFGVGVVKNSYDLLPRGANDSEISEQLATILARVVEVVRTVSDPEDAEYEVEQIQREAAIQVAQAQSAQAARGA